MGIEISAVVCTHNRAGYLRKALQSLAEQTLPPQQHEILVIDNGSTDETRRVVEPYLAFPHWRYISEPVLGLSRARNTAWQAAQGQYVAYLDDDAVATPQWLARLLEAFQTAGPGVGCIGGRNLPIWEAEQPGWLPDQMLGAFSLYHYADVPVVITEQQWLAGCNIAYPREVLQQVGGFPENLGRQGTKLLAQEEIRVRQCLDSLGLTSVYYPQAVVGHHVQASRLTKPWLRQHAYWQGRSTAALMAMNGEPGSSSRRVGLSIASVAWAAPRLALMLTSATAAQRFRRQCQVIEKIGQVTGLWI